MIRGRPDAGGLRVPRYDSFLLRIWRSNGQQGSQVAVHLQHLQSGETVRYEDRDALFAYLRRLLDSPDECPQELIGHNGIEAH